MSAEKRPEPCKHDLLLSERISQNAVAAVVKDIFDINRDDDKKKNSIKIGNGNLYAFSSIPKAEMYMTVLHLLISSSAAKHLYTPCASAPA